MIDVRYCRWCDKEVEDKAEPSMDGKQQPRWVHYPGGYSICFPQQPGSTRAEPEERAVPEVTEDPTKRGPRAASYLSPPDLRRLDWACAPIRQAFGTPPYLVGSVLTRPDCRDIDIRLILADDQVESMFPTNGVRLLLNVALSDLIASAANVRAPIDFQIQSMTEANVPEHGMRNPLGIRDLARDAA